MKLRGWRVDGFGVLSNIRCDGLPDGLTVIHGPNEAGKSTLLRFLRRLLFGRWTGREKRLSDPPLRGGMHGGSLSIEDDAGGVWTLSRHESRAGVNRLIDPSGRQVADDQAEIRLAELCGHADAALMHAIFSFDLKELASLELNDSAQLREALFAASTTGAGASAAAALTTLDAEASRWVAPRRADAVLNVLLDQLRQLDLRLEQARSEQSGYAVLLRRIQQLEFERAELTRATSRLDAEQRELDQREALRVAIGQREAAAAALAGLALDPGLAALQVESSGLAAAASGFEAKAAQARTLQATLDELDQRLSELSARGPDAEIVGAPWLPIALTLLSSGSGLACIGLSLRSDRENWVLAGGLLLGMAAVGAVWWRLAAQRESQRAAARQAQGLIRQELSPRRVATQSALSALQLELDEWRANARRLLERAGLPRPDGDALLVGVVGELARTTERAAIAAREQRSRQEEWDRAEATVARLTARFADPEQALTDIGEAERDEVARESIRARARETQSELEGKLRELTLAQDRRRVLESAHDLPELATQRSALVGQIAVAAREWAARRWAGQLIEGTLARFQSEHQPAVLTHASAALATLTNGRWTQVEADQSAGLTAGGPLGTRQPHELSRGSAEQLYLALRFGLVRHVASTRSALPVIVDEVLVNFDPGRQRAAASLLAELARDVQVLYFTCHPDVVDRLLRADPEARVVALPDPERGE